MPTRNALATRFVIVAMASIATVDAACIDVVDVEAELPQNLVTSNNTGVSYSYDLEREQYHVSWGKEGNSGGPYGPFTLTRGCAPAKVKWESDAFLLLEAGCGTFCWYVLVFPLTESNGDHTRIERPLAFDDTRNLLAYYHAKDIIRIENLINGQQQEVRTVYTCDSASGLCIEEVRFTDTSLEYKWRYDPDSRPLSVLLEEQLFDH